MSTKDQSLSNMVTPKLRFPEFREAPGWTTQRLVDLTDVVRGGSPRPIDAYITTGPDGLNWLKIGDVLKDAKYITGTEQKVVSSALSKTRLISPGDFILSNSMSFGRAYISRIQTCIHDGWIAVTSLPDSFSRDFLYYTMMSEASQTYFENQAAGGGVRNLTVEIVKLLPVGMPDSAEQREIAACLTSLDEMLAAARRKLEALAVHKKGLMQQLFPLEGESRPCLRFPEFHGAPAWKTRKLSSILIKDNRTVALDDNATYREIGVRSHGRGLFHKEPTTGKAIGEKRVFHVVPGALVINIVFAWEQAIAVTTADEVGFIASHRFPMFVPKENRCDVGFMQRLFLTPRGNELLKVASPGGAGRNRTLSQKEFENLEAIIPETAEQQRIAACLTSMDSLIAAEVRKLDGLRAHKRGLMQQLFPSRESD